MELTQVSDRAPALPSTLTMNVTISAILSFFAALGTIPYGYQFPTFFGWENSTLLISFGVFFAFCACIANMMLGTYSLLNIKNKKTEKIKLNVIVVSTLGSIPYGFLCYFGYQNTMPFLINIIISVIVVIVNTGIGYTAIKNLIISFKELFHPEKQKTHARETISHIVGFLIGIAISLVTYLAASSGITDLLVYYNQTTLLQYNVGFILAVISWIPCAALFANANQIVAAELYNNLKSFQKFFKNINWVNILFFIFCIASGTAIAQMTSDSFSAKRIPALFKSDFVQYVAQHYLIVIALFSSAALNYFSMKKLFPNLGKTK